MISWCFNVANVITTIDSDLAFYGREKSAREICALDVELGTPSSVYKTIQYYRRPLWSWCINVDDDISMIHQVR